MRIWVGLGYAAIVLGLIVIWSMMIILGLMVIWSMMIIMEVLRGLA